METDRARPHFGQTEAEMALFDLQHVAICYIEAFYRHLASEIARVSGDAGLSAQDCVILHAIRFGERPKGIPELQHFTNRSDIANIQYSVRKLTRSGLVQQARKSAGRGTAYELTERGRAVTDEYARARREVLSTLPFAPDEFLERTRGATRLLEILTGVYDHRSRAPV